MSSRKRQPNRLLRFEQLEERRVLSGITITLYRSELRILGTPQNDMVAASELAGGLNVDGQTGSGPTNTVGFEREQIEYLRKIVFFGQEGNDTFDGSRASYKFVLDGGAGRDILRGGPANDMLRGGPDFDRLYGRGGDRDFLDGGKDWLADFLDANRPKPSRQPTARISTPTNRFSDRTAASTSRMSTKRKGLAALPPRWPRWQETTPRSVRIWPTASATRATSDTWSGCTPHPGASAMLKCVLRGGESRSLATRQCSRQDDRRT